MISIRLKIGDRKYWAITLLLLIVVVHGYVLLQPEQGSVPAFAFSVSPAPSSSQTDQEPLFRTDFVSSSIDDYVHSSSIAPLPDGGLIAVWFAGSREGAPDVDIRGARFDPSSQSWSHEFTLISREATGVSLNRYINKLGNPVIALGPDNRLWLFYVSTSVGGWGTSAINTMFSDDCGTSWSPPKRLVTSPFFNLSTLVRNSPVFHQDGSIGLPVYHESLGKFAEYLHLSPDGEILDKFRNSKGRHSLQPTNVPLSEDSAVALMRNAGRSPGKVLASFTADRGQTWTESAPVDPWNPNSALAAVTAQRGDEILVVLNNLQAGRHRLSLYQTDSDLHPWRLVKILDESPTQDGQQVPLEDFRPTISNELLFAASHVHGDRLQAFLLHLERRACTDTRGCEFEYEYPSLITSTNGLFHVVYSWNNSLIKHVTFNRAWLERKQ
jgi:predicted neuraminidase